MLDMPVEGGTHGSRLDGNPMYSGRGMTIFTPDAEEHMEALRANVEDGVDCSSGDGMALAAVLLEVIILCWDIVDEDLWQTVGATTDLWQTVGASAARDGERMPRVFRDISIAVAHRNAQRRELLYGEVGRHVLGEPRVPFGG
jgi:hypothetical protein